MNKTWVIALGGVVVAIAAVFAYLNFTGTDTGLQQAAAPEKGALEVTLGENEHVIGDMDAPVTIVEYASLTCPHCANFHTEILPTVKKELLETGKAKLVYRDFPLDQLALRAAGLVRCAQPLQRGAMLDLLFRTQGTWAASQDPLAALDQIGRSVGMSSEVAQKCMQDQGALDAVIAQRLEAEQLYNINSTPSFIIGGKLYGGGLTAEQMAELVEDLTP